MAGIFSRIKASYATLKHGWNAFQEENFRYPSDVPYNTGGSYGYYRPDRSRTPYSAEKTIISSIYTRMSIDVSGVELFHVRVDKDTKRYAGDIDSGLNNCLTVEANIDQGARQFRQDMAMSLFQQGTIAVVPVDTTSDPTISGAFDVQTLRVGEIVSWFPEHVRVSLYNQKKGYREEITLAKSFVAVVENPLYAVMNEPNSTLQRLIRKLNMLDVVDEASSSGKLDLIIQLPYVVKSEARRAQAHQRRTDLEEQLKGPYGIAYADGTEKITQLNRAVENNFLSQIQYLSTMLYAELGITDTVMNGTADESTMLNYIERSIKPVLDAIAEAMQRAFLTKTARSQGQSIMYFRDLFSLVPLSQLAEITDMFSRNEIMSPNEIRTAIGMKPSKDPKADQLQNSNMPQPSPLPAAAPSSGDPAAVLAAAINKNPQLARAKQPLAIESGGTSQNGRSLQR